ncbi:MAG: hypothetical protein K0U52_06330 [Gammaproteobacteria bacterium]|nr:hypothetical protein [Gammaproteobacteria bacterium]
MATCTHPFTFTYGLGDTGASTVQLCLDEEHELAFAQRYWRDIEDERTDMVTNYKPVIRAYINASLYRDYDYSYSFVESDSATTMALWVPLSLTGLYALYQ